MKTFKMLAFHLQLEDQEPLVIPLIDGIVINLENSHKLWILELFVDASYYEQFQNYLISQQLIDANVVISFPDNEPAPFSLIVHNIQQMDTRISVLLKGTVRAQRQRYAEKLLQQLINEGLVDQALLERFQHDMKKRPKLKN